MKTIDTRDVRAGQRLLITGTTGTWKGWINRIAEIKSVDPPYAAVIVNPTPNLIPSKLDVIHLDEFTFAQPSDDFLRAMDAEAEWPEEIQIGQEA